MAQNFPSNPVLGDQYQDYVFDGTSWKFAQTLPGGLPCGSVITWSGATAPPNWLLCDGSAVSRTTYSSLFAVVGTSYGSGDGSTTFNLPDLRGRVPVGKNGGTFGTLGSTGGAETHTLDISQIPSHNHGGATSTNGAHTHTLSGSNGGSVNLGPSVTSNSNGDFGYFLNGGRANSAGDHSHSITAQGGGGAHNNLQPYQVLNYIIKHTVAVTPGESELAPRVSTVESVNTTQNSRLAAIETEASKQAFAQVNKTTLQAFGSGFMTIQFNEILFAKNIQLIGNLIRFTYPGVYKLSVGMRIANDAGDSWTGMSLYNATAGRVGISYGTGNVAGDPGPMEFTFLANITNTSVDYAIQLYRAGSVLTQLTPDVNAGKAIAATIERLGAL